ncbi:MAG: PCRF domain-containing protein, partial [Verrucomicrobia bacterium]
MDYSDLIAQRRRRLGEIDDMIAEPSFFGDPKRASEVMREHRRIKQTLDLSDRLDRTRRELAENEELAKSDDLELAAIAREEIPALQASIPQLAEDLQYALLPADPNEDRDAIIEIRAGAGGDEASLFAA